MGFFRRLFRRDEPTYDTLFERDQAQAIRLGYGGGRQAVHDYRSDRDAGHLLGRKAAADIAGTPFRDALSKPDMTISMRLAGGMAGADAARQADVMVDPRQQEPEAFCRQRERELAEERLSESEVLANISHDAIVRDGLNCGRSAKETVGGNVRALGDIEREARERFIFKVREHVQMHMTGVDPAIAGAIERSVSSLARLLLDPEHDEVPR